MVKRMVDPVVYRLSGDGEEIASAIDSIEADKTDSPDGHDWLPFPTSITGPVTDPFVQEAFNSIHEGLYGGLETINDSYFTALPRLPDLL